MISESSYGVWSLLPPAVALGLALWKKQIHVALLLGIILGWWIVEDWNPFRALGQTLTGLVAVFQDGGNTRIIFYSMLVGSMLVLVSASGGVAGFVDWVNRRNLVTNRRRAQLVPLVIGLVITVESSITALIAGTVGRPLTDRYRISREKLAYICDSTSAPICILVPFNGWGAYVIGLLAVQGVESPVAVLLASIPLNFYALIAIAIVLITVVTAKDMGPMKSAEQRAITAGKVLGDGAQPVVSDEVLSVEMVPGAIPRARNLILPVLTMVLAIITGIYFTGKLSSASGAGIWEIIQASSGSTAVLWAVLSSVVILAVLTLGSPAFNGQLFLNLVFRGMGGMIPVVTLLVLAFALGGLVREMGTGVYIAQLISNVANIKWAVAGLFLLSCIMAFATGTSWGTFALMIPIAVPLAASLDANLSLFVAASLGGGIFGDHCSPLSDTTIISSMASASDHIDHVRTQLPYAILGAILALACYLIIA